MTEHSLTPATPANSTPANSTPAIDPFDRVLSILERSLQDQVLVSQDRCIDGLLDLYNVAANSLVRQLVVDILNDVRFLSAVRAADLADRLTEVRAAMAVELAFCS